ncbi:MAG: hypothetical protein O9325_16860 [Roseomonas sp.]|nr:hypothetical protein [Roseomonas sp.]
MTTQAEHFQHLWREYEREHDHAPASAREVVDWAVANKGLALPRVDPRDVLAAQMSRALREEYATDAQGRRYRVNHAVRITKNGVQTTFWGILGFADHSHMERAFTQRREQVIGDLVQLQVDVEVYNEKAVDQPDIQLVLDFNDDVAERRAG